MIQLKDIFFAVPFGILMGGAALLMYENRVFCIIGTTLILVAWLCASCAHFSNRGK